MSGVKHIGDRRNVGWLSFVGLEMRQPQIIAKGNRVQARADAQKALMTNPLEGDQGLLPLLSFGSMPRDADVSEEDKPLDEQLTLARLASLQASWQQSN